MISKFPVDGASQVNAVVARRDGFVAVGTVSDDSAICIADANNGHVWSTTDGQTWVPEPPDPFAQTDLTNLVSFKDSIYAFGFVGAFDQEASSECSPGPNPTGLNVWRSGDGGANWEHLPQSPAIAHVTVGDVTVAGDQLVLVGSQTDADGNDAAGSWSSPDGVAWTPAVLPPATSILGTVAAHDNVIVGFGFDSNFPLPWITRDGGGHWYEESVDVPGAQSDANGDVGISIEDVLATASGYVDGLLIPMAAPVARDPGQGKLESKPKPTMTLSWAATVPRMEVAGGKTAESMRGHRATTTTPPRRCHGRPSATQPAPAGRRPP